MRIGLTQRVEVISAYGERRDCLDQKWVSVVESLGALPIPLSNTVLNVSHYLECLRIEALFLTGGNDLGHLEGASFPAPERDRFEEAAFVWALENNIPVLGICRGMQFINHFWGGCLCRIAEHAGVRHTVVLKNISSEVNSYHNWAVPRTGLGETLRPIAFDNTGYIEAFEGVQSSLLGIMWHPERENVLSDLDQELINKLLGKC